MTTAQTGSTREAVLARTWAANRLWAPSAAAVWANAWVAMALVVAALLHARNPDLYYRIVQEDEVLEWASFWSFAGAAIGFGVAAARRDLRVGKTWYVLAVTGFCLFVAMEEVSWGQRLLGYRPPAYFLEHNYQQELNLHNVVGTEYRKLALTGIIAGYGIALPLLFVWPPAARALGRLGIAPAPSALMPSFVATLATYLWYPWTHTGEWVEFMLGLGFLFAAFLMAERPWGLRLSSRNSAWPIAVPLVGVVVVGLGAATAAFSGVQESDDPARMAAARVETEALRQDFAGGRLRSDCGLHKRLYSYAERYGERELLRGAFAGLVERGLPQARARYLLDPWSSPYWVRDSCSFARRRATFVYSFGPNRRRDSSPWEIRGDDLGAFIRQEGDRPPDRSAETKNVDDAR